MQQVPEIAHVDFRAMATLNEGLSQLVRNSILLPIMLLICSCDHGAGSEANHSPTDQANKLGEERVLRRGIPGDPSTLDPHLADDEFSMLVLRDLYEGLTSEDRDGRVTPGVASSWDVDKSGTVYTFQIRSSARWSDGQRIVASDFVEGLRHAVDPHTASSSASLLFILKNARAITSGQRKVADLGVTALSETQVRIDLEQPAPFILGILSQPIAAPLHAHAKMRNTTNGAYTLANRIPGSFIELERNPSYWDVANVKIKRIRYVDVESQTTELNEYLAGQLDLTYTIPTPDLGRILASRNSEVQMQPILGTLYLALNLSRQPLSESVALRQALSMAVDRAFIANNVMTGVSPAYSLVPPTVGAYTPASYDWAMWPRVRQLEQARALFARAGYSDKHPLRLRLYFNNGETIRRIMVAVAASWRQNLGVETQLLSEEFRVFLSGRKDRNKWDVARLGWFADYNDAASFLDLFAVNSQQNDSGYVSTLFNELFAASQREPEEVKRSSLLRKSEETLLNDYPIVPVYFYKARRLVKPYLGGAEISPMNRTYSKHLFWKVQSSPVTRK